MSCGNFPSLEFCNPRTWKLYRFDITQDFLSLLKRKNQHSFELRTWKIVDLKTRAERFVCMMPNLDGFWFCGGHRSNLYAQKLSPWKVHCYKGAENFECKLWSDPLKLKFDILPGEPLLKG